MKLLHVHIGTSSGHKQILVNYLYKCVLNFKKIFHHNYQGFFFFKSSSVLEGLSLLMPWMLELGCHFSTNPNHCAIQKRFVDFLICILPKKKKEKNLG